MPPPKGNPVYVGPLTPLTSPPKSKAKYLNSDDYHREVGAGHSEKARHLTKHPEGTWRRDPMKMPHGHYIEELRRVPIASLHAPEMAYGKDNNELHPAKRADAEEYAEKVKKGHEMPPITVIQHESGSLRVTDGHRRLAAHKAAGRTHIKAWVSYTVDHPEGLKDSNGKTMKTGLTHEIAHGERVTESLNEESLDPKAVHVMVPHSTISHGELAKHLAGYNKSATSHVYHHGELHAIPFAHSSAPGEKYHAVKFNQKRYASHFAGRLSRHLQDKDPRAGEPKVKVIGEATTVHDLTADATVSKTEPATPKASVHAILSKHAITTIRPHTKGGHWVETSDEAAAHAAKAAVKAHGHVTSFGIQKLSHDRFRFRVGGAAWEDKTTPAATVTEQYVSIPKKPGEAFLPVSHQHIADVHQGKHAGSEVKHGVDHHVLHFPSMAHAVAFASKFTKETGRHAHVNESLTEAAAGHWRNHKGMFSSLNKKGGARWHPAINKIVKEMCERLGAKVKSGGTGGGLTLIFKTQEAANTAHTTLAERGIRVTKHDLPGILFINQLFEDVQAGGNIGGGGETADQLSQPGVEKTVDGPEHPKTECRCGKSHILPGRGEDKRPDSDYPADALAKGVEDEAEHSPDIAVRKTIAKDHLDSDKKYYEKLAKYVESVKLAKEAAAQGDDAIAVVETADGYNYTPLSEAVEAGHAIETVFDSCGEELTEAVRKRHRLMSKIHSQLAKAAPAGGKRLRKARNAYRWRIRNRGRYNLQARTSVSRDPITSHLDSGK